MLAEIAFFIYCFLKISIYIRCLKIIGFKKNPHAQHNLHGSTNLRSNMTCRVS